MTKNTYMEIMDFIITHKYALLTLLGAVIVAFGAFTSSIEQKRSEKALVEANEEIRQLSALTIQLQDENNKELKHQTSMLTGGNTFPIVAFSCKDNEAPHIFEPALFASGKYPLFNFSMKININNWDQAKKNEYLYEIPELKQISPNYLDKDLVFDVEKFPNLTINIRTSARNGTWSQQVKFRKIADGKYQYETSVIPYGEKIPLINKQFNQDSISIGSMSNIESLKFKK